ncbi:MAG: hypothetical protein MUP81_01545 [Dehalococcoidia bacterium]|nr:hypothetical protein [Dehalococcoidia bacterium]
MKTKIACVSCGEFFEAEIQEVNEFIAHGADAGFLKRIPFPPEYRKQIKTRKEYLVFLLMAYCPYCREVKFGRATCPELPREGLCGRAWIRLSEAKYLRAFKNEIRKNGGFQTVDTSQDFIALVDDEN